MRNSIIHLTFLTLLFISYSTLSYGKVTFEAAKKHYYKEKKTDYGDDTRTKLIAQYTSAIASNPSNEEVYLKRGDLYDDAGEYDLAIADFTKVIEINPRSTSAYLKRALSSRYKTDKSGAILDYGKIIELNPQSDSAYSGRGNLYLDKKDYGKAMSDFTEAIKLKPGYLSYYYRGRAHMEEYMLMAKIPQTKVLQAVQAAHLNAAIEDFTQAIKIDPSASGVAGLNIYNERAYLYFVRQEFDKCWNDVYVVKAVEEKIFHRSTIMDSDFVKELKKVSGREK